MAEFEVRIDRLRRNAENGQNIYRKKDAFSDRIYSIAEKHLTMQKRHRNCFIPLKVSSPVMNRVNGKLLGKKEIQMRRKKRKKTSGQGFGKNMRQ